MLPFAFFCPKFFCSWIINFYFYIDYLNKLACGSKHVVFGSKIGRTMAIPAKKMSFCSAKLYKLRTYVGVWNGHRNRGMKWGWDPDPHFIPLFPPPFHTPIPMPISYTPIPIPILFPIPMPISYPYSDAISYTPIPMPISYPYSDPHFIPLFRCPFHTPILMPISYTL